MAGEGTLGLEIDAPVLEIGIEPLLRVPVTVDERLRLVVVDVERSCLPKSPEVPWRTFGHRMVQEAVADQVDEPVAGHSGAIFGEKVRVLLDEADDIVVSYLRGPETAQAVGGHYEFVAIYALPVTADTDVGRIAHAVPAVEPVAGIHQQVLDVHPVLEIVVC